MIFISSVSLAQVLASMDGCPEETKKEASKRAHWFEWVFDWDDLGTITDQDKANPSVIAPISAIHPLLSASTEKRGNLSREPADAVVGPQRGGGRRSRHRTNK